MRVTFLGTGASIPMPNRALPAVALAHAGMITLFDCGEGTQFQLMRAGLSPSKIRCVCISHLHGDHLFGLPGLLASLSLASRTAPLRVLGPAGLVEYLHATQRLTGSVPSFPLEVNEVPQDSEEWVLRIPQAIIRARWLDHTVSCLGFRFAEDDLPGKFDAEAAARLGVPPGPQRQALVRGETITLSDGREVRPEAVVGPPRPGRKIAYCVDTRPCAGSVLLAQGVDLLIHDGTFATKEVARARESGHSTAAQAAQVALQACARRLVLTHISARYVEDVAPLLSESRALFPATEVAHDLWTVVLNVRR
ncbi:MAG: ribonuclease Z [candidate division KSB1 bacterium]|nr:ribonuclease Z [candidate division KSB1 bacterium]